MQFKLPMNHNEVWDQTEGHIKQDPHTDGIGVWTVKPHPSLWPCNLGPTDFIGHKCLQLDHNHIVIKTGWGNTCPLSMLRPPTLGMEYLRLKFV